MDHLIIHLIWYIATAFILGTVLGWWIYGSSR